MNHESLCLKCFIKNPEWVTTFSKRCGPKERYLIACITPCQPGKVSRQAELAGLFCKIFTNESTLFLPLASYLCHTQPSTEKLEKVKHCTPKPNAIHIKVQRGPGSGQLNLPSYLITGHFLIKPTRVHTPLLTMGLHFRKQFGIWRARGG